MTFNIYPKTGFLNTYFGLKVSQDQEDVSFRFVFSDGSSTDWLTGTSIVYKQFQKAGEQTIILETAHEQLERKLIIQNSLKLGLGRTWDIYFLKNPNIIIQRKSTGIVIYNTSFNSEIIQTDVEIQNQLTKSTSSLKNSLSLDILPNEIWDWDQSHCIFFLQTNKSKFPKGTFVFFDLHRCEYLETFEANLISFDSHEPRLIIHIEDKIIIRQPQNDPVEIEGQFQNMDQTANLFFKRGHTLFQYNFLKDTISAIGEYDFHAVTNALNLIVLQKDDLYFVWDTNLNLRRTTLYSTEYKISPMGKILTSGSDPTWWNINITNEKGEHTNRTEKFETFWTEDESFLIRSSSKGYFMAYLTEDLNRFELINYGFEEVVIADLVKISVEGKTELFSLKHNQIVSCEQGLIKFGFKKSNNVYVIAENDRTNSVLFHEYTEGGELNLIQRYEGRFYPENLQELLNNNHLWITSSSYDFIQIFEGITNLKLNEIRFKSDYGDWILTKDSKFIHNKTFQEVHSNYESYYAVDPTLNYGIIQRPDGYYLVNIRGEKLMENKIFESDLIYTQCDVHPSGKFAVLSQPGLSQILDLDTLERIEVPDTSFLRFDAEGRIVVKSLSAPYAAPRLFDPTTFNEISHTDLAEYIFNSPDGSLKSNLKIQQRSTANGNERFISIFHSNKNHQSNVAIKSDPIFTNFLSFSSKNRFFAHAGKEIMNGFVELFKIDLTQSSVKAIDSKIFRTPKAVWRCVFSLNEKWLGYYSSEPTSFVLDLDQAFDRTAEPRQIENRSVECFSPDSLFVVLSQHRYDAITSGGVGWIPSSKIWIADIEDFETLLELSEHTTQVVFANFSFDGKKFISRSDDGIILIRHFDYASLKDAKERKHAFKFVSSH